MSEEQAPYEPGPAPENTPSPIEPPFVNITKEVTLIDAARRLVEIMAPLPTRSREESDAWGDLRKAISRAEIFQGEPLVVEETALTALATATFTTLHYEPEYGRIGAIPEPPVDETVETPWSDQLIEPEIEEVSVENGEEPIEDSLRRLLDESQDSLFTEKAVSEFLFAHLRRQATRLAGLQMFNGSLDINGANQFISAELGATQQVIDNIRR